MKTFLLTALLTLFAFSAVLYTSCHKDKCSGVTCYNGGACNNGNCLCPTGYYGSKCENSSILFQNDTYTPISLTVNGTNTNIPVNGSVSVIGSAGTSAVVSAVTGGTYGLSYSWAFTDNFPTGGNGLTEPLDVDPSYFYLEITNTDVDYITGLIVNSGNAAATVESVSIPNSGVNYGVGYYQAYSNTKVSYTFSDGTQYLTPNLLIPNTSNASYSLSVN